MPRPPKLTLEEHRRRRAEKRQTLKLSGICMVCHVRSTIDGKSTCIECQEYSSKRAHSRWKERKSAVIQHLGGKCVDCGLVSEHTCVYDLHHIDPQSKDVASFNAFNFQRPWALIMNELDKCILLCANCHRIRHDGQPRPRRKDNGT